VAVLEDGVLLAAVERGPGAADYLGVIL